jgi:beta-lactamase class A
VVDLAALLADEQGTFGVYARNLTTDEVASFAADRVMDTASAAKVFILVHYAKLVSAGTLDPHERVAVGSDEYALGSGVVRFLEPVELTLDDLATLMIIVSDNTATDVLMRAAGGADAVNQTMNALGLSTACVNPKFAREGMMGEPQPFGLSSARDLAEAFTHLDKRCRAILLRQQFTEGLPRALPHANMTIDWGFEMPVRVFNKTGGDPGVYTDAARFEADSAQWVAAFLAADLKDLNHPDDTGPRVAGAVGQALFDAWAS